MRRPRLCPLTLALALALATAFVATHVHGFYLPGVAPVDYQDGSLVELKANKLTSVITQLPYEYFSLPFCKPRKVVETAENLGEVLMGDRIVNLNYEILMGRNEACKVLCSRQYSANELNAFRRHVKDQYRVQWLLDNLPAASPRMVKDPDTGKENKVYELGFPLGQLVRIKPQNPKDKTLLLSRFWTKAGRLGDCINRQD